MTVKTNSIKRTFIFTSVATIIAVFFIIAIIISCTIPTWSSTLLCIIPISLGFCFTYQKVKVELAKLNKILSKRSPTSLQPITHPNKYAEELIPNLEALNQLFFQFKDTIERNKRFAADAAHELRTPLAALKTLIQVTIKQNDPDKIRDALKNILVGVNRSSHTVDQLLTLCKIAPEETLKDLTEVNMCQIAAEIIAFIVPRALKKNIDIELIAPEHPLNIMGDEISLSILLRNLVDNAVRYTPKDGCVKVTIAEENGKIHCCVRDNGPGIPAEYRARVFERFFRVLGNKASGSGLGLSIVQQIAELHNAKVILGANPEGDGLQINVVFDKA